MRRPFFSKSHRAATTSSSLVAAPWDDSSSQSSTATVLSDSKPASSSLVSCCASTSSEHASSLFSRRGGSRVKFDESRNICTKSAANAKYAQACWYTPEDYLGFKTQVVRLSNKIASSTEKEYCSYRRILSSVVNTLGRVTTDDGWEHGSFLCYKDQQDLYKCLGKCNTRLGLERMTITALAESANARRAILLQSVRDPGDSAVDPERKMCEVCQDLSRPCRLFALEKARALASHSLPQKSE